MKCIKNAWKRFANGLPTLGPRPGSEPTASLSWSPFTLRRQLRLATALLAKSLEQAESFRQLAQERNRECERLAGILRSLSEPKEPTIWDLNILKPQGREAYEWMVEHNGKEYADRALTSIIGQCHRED